MQTRHLEQNDSHVHQNRARYENCSSANSVLNIGKKRKSTFDQSGLCTYVSDPHNFLCISYIEVVQILKTVTRINANFVLILIAHNFLIFGLEWGWSLVRLKSILGRKKKSQPNKIGKCL